MIGSVIIPPTLRPSASSISMTLSRQYVLPAPGRPVIPIFSASPIPPTRFVPQCPPRYKRPQPSEALTTHGSRRLGRGPCGLGRGRHEGPGPLLAADLADHERGRR